MFNRKKIEKLKEDLIHCKRNLEIENDKLRVQLDFLENKDGQYNSYYIAFMVGDAPKVTAHFKSKIVWAAYGSCVDLGKDKAESVLRKCLIGAPITDVNGVSYPSRLIDSAKLVEVKS